MNKIVLTITFALLCIGFAFGAYRFFTSRTETQSFELENDASVLETAPAPVTEDRPAENKTADEPEPTEPTDDTEEHSVSSIDTNPIPVESVPEPEPEPEPETKSVSAPSITDRLVSFGHEDRPSRNIDTIIIHSSYDALGDEPYSVSGIIEEYRQYGVAAHYLIDRGGKIYRLVEDRDVAYHAGVSAMPDGRTGVNAFSIGIEIVEKDTDSPTEAQYAGLNDLLGYLKSKYAIEYVLGHDDIAPGRKTDPWNFDWSQLW
jgi:hypothetical protein